MFGWLSRVFESFRLPAHKAESVPDPSPNEVRRVTSSHERIPPFPKNALGDFYVEDECCLCCEAPHIEAPELVVHDDGSYPHCYFQRQPTTPGETEQAIQACVVSCTRSVRYGGTDAAILRRFEELQSTDSCDALVPKLAPP